MRRRTCRRCGATLPSGRKSFCSKPCHIAWLGEFGTAECPKLRPNYDYSSYDPEDELYGEYDDVPHPFSTGGRRSYAPPDTAELDDD